MRMKQTEYDDALLTNLIIDRYLLDDNVVRPVYLQSPEMIMIKISIGSYSTTEGQPLRYFWGIIFYKGNSVSDVAAVVSCSVSFESQNVVDVACCRFGVDLETKTDPELRSPGLNGSDTIVSIYNSWQS